MPATASFSLNELAEAVDGRVLGDGGFEIEAIRVLDSAGERDLSFLHSPAYLQKALASGAGALLLPEQHADLATQLARPVLVAKDSQLALARLIRHLHPLRLPPAGVHQTAVIGERCEIADSAHIGPYVVIGDDSRVGDGAVVESHSVIGRECVLGEGVWLHAGVVLYDATRLGDRVEVHSGTVIGADGFGYATVAGVHHKMPQVGHVEIGSDVEVGANSAIDRALLEETRIGAGSKIDNLVQVGHNVHTGRACILCGQVGIAGSTVLGDYVVLGGQSGVVDHKKLGDQVQVAATSAIFNDIPAGSQIGGTPAVDLGQYRRQVAVLGKLPGLMRRLRRLERRLDELEDESTDG